MTTTFKMTATALWYNGSTTAKDQDGELSLGGSEVYRIAGGMMLRTPVFIAGLTYKRMSSPLAPGRDTIAQEGVNIVSLVGAITGSSGTSVSPTMIVPILGSVTSQSICSATTTNSWLAIAGSSDAISQASAATLNKRIPLSGEVTAISAAASAYVNSTIAIAGSADAVSSGRGALAIPVAIVPVLTMGACVATSSASGDIFNAVLMVGSCTAISNATAPLINPNDLTSLSYYGSKFRLLEARQLDKATIRVRYSHDPIAISDLGINDALNPNNYSVSGASANDVLKVTAVVNDPQGFDLSVGANLTTGAWSLTVINVWSDNDLALP